MEYESLFSTSVKQKIRLIVEQSNNPKTMEIQIKAEFGDAALSIARQIAAETKGFEWLRAGRKVPDESNTLITDIKREAAPQEKKHPKNPILAAALARGRLAKEKEYLKSRELAQDLAKGRLRSEKEALPNPTKASPSFSDIFRLRKIFFIIALMALASFIIKKCSDNQKSEDKAYVGTLATVAGNMYASALQTCRQIGITDIDACSKNTGILVQDRIAKQLASAAMERGKNYIEKCGEYYPEDYCLNQFNRAFRIGLNSPQQ